MNKRLFITLGLFVMISNPLLGQTNDSTVDETSNKVLIQNEQTDSARVFVSFIVEPTGKVTNIKIMKIECPNCSKEFEENLKLEAIKVVKLMPPFGKTNKKRVKFILPLKFVIN